MNRVITISREFGSGGRTIGKQVAERLGIPCYDQELIEKIEEKSGLAKEFIAERGEYTLRGGWLANAFADRSLNGLSVQDYLWTVQRKTIIELAEQGPCVIVGRCGDYILQGKADLLKVFIHADIAARAKRIVEKYGEMPVSDVVYRGYDSACLIAEAMKSCEDIHDPEAMRAAFLNITAFEGVQGTYDFSDGSGDGLDSARTYIVDGGKNILLETYLAK